MANRHKLIAGENLSTAIRVEFPKEFEAHSKRVDFLNERGEKWTIGLYTPEFQDYDMDLDRLNLSFRLPNEVTIDGELTVQFLAYKPHEHIITPFDVVTFVIEKGIMFGKARAQENPDLLVRSFEHSVWAVDTVRQAVKDVREAESVSNEAIDVANVALNVSQQAHELFILAESHALEAMDNAEQAAQSASAAEQQATFANELAALSETHIQESLLLANKSKEAATIAKNKAKLASDKAVQVSQDLAASKAFVAESAEQVSQSAESAKLAKKSADESFVMLQEIKHLTTATSEESLAQVKAAETHARDSARSAATAERAAEKALERTAISQEMIGQANNSASLSAESARVAEDAAIKAANLATQTQAKASHFLELSNLARGSADNAEAHAQAAKESAAAAVKIADNAVEQGNMSKESAQRSADSALTASNRAREAAESARESRDIIAQINDSVETVQTAFNSASELSSSANQNAVTAKEFSQEAKQASNDALQKVSDLTTRANNGEFVGASGQDGSNGADGNDGRDGQDGQDGKQGEKGERGEDGNGFFAMDATPWSTAQLLAAIPEIKVGDFIINTHDSNRNWGGFTVSPGTVVRVVDLAINPDEQWQFERRGAIRGIQGIVGPAPTHQWNGTSVRFQHPSGSWGEWIDLQGDKGLTGENGKDGADGNDGAQGAPIYSVTNNLLFNFAGSQSQSLSEIAFGRLIPAVTENPPVGTLVIGFSDHVGGLREHEPGVFLLRRAAYGLTNQAVGYYEIVHRIGSATINHASASGAGDTKALQLHDPRAELEFMVDTSLVTYFRLLMSDTNEFIEELNHMELEEKLAFILILAQSILEMTGFPYDWVDRYTPPDLEIETTQQMFNLITQLNQVVFDLLSRGEFVRRFNRSQTFMVYEFDNDFTIRTHEFDAIFLNNMSFSSSEINIRPTARPHDSWDCCTGHSFINTCCPLFGADLRFRYSSNKGTLFIEGKCRFSQGCELFDFIARFDGFAPWSSSFDMHPCCSPMTITQKII